MAKPISETIRMFQGGDFNLKCGELFASVLRGVEDTGKASSSRSWPWCPLPPVKPHQWKLTDETPAVADGPTTPTCCAW